MSLIYHDVSKRHLHTPFGYNHADILTQESKSMQQVRGKHLFSVTRNTHLVWHVLGVFFSYTCPWTQGRQVVTTEWAIQVKQDINKCIFTNDKCVCCQWSWRSSGCLLGCHVFIEVCQSNCASRWRSHPSLSIAYYVDCDTFEAADRKAIVNRIGLFTDCAVVWSLTI